MERVSIGAFGETPAEMAAMAGEAEAAGFEAVWCLEIFRAALTQATHLSTLTESIDVGTGIAWAFTRSPMNLAMSAMDIDEISGGRFRLGLGAGVRRLNEKWHNAGYGRPAPHLREAVEATRAIIHAAAASEPVRFKGSYYDLDIRGWSRGAPPVRDSIPIYCAAVQRGMARMAGDVADGLIGHPMCSPEWLDRVVVPAFEEGLSRSSRRRSDFTYIPSVCVAVDEDEGRAMDAARRTVAFYATVRTYLPLFELHGFASNAADAAAAFRAGDPGAVAAAITDEMVEAYCAAGPPDKVLARVAELAARGDGILPGAPTYFIPPEQVAEYNRRILEIF